MVSYIGLSLIRERETLSCYTVLIEMLSKNEYYFRLAAQMLLHRKPTLFQNLLNEIKRRKRAFERIFGERIFLERIQKLFMLEEEKLIRKMVYCL